MNHWPQLTLTDRAGRECSAGPGHHFGVWAGGVDLRSGDRWVCRYRIVAFPELSVDVGDWWEPLGVVSIAAETVVVAAALVVLRRRTPAGW